jgi:hypothetical protein
VVALAENDAGGVPVVAQGFPEGPGGVKTPAEEAVVDGLVVPRHQPADDLGAGIVEAPPQDAAVRGTDRDRLVIVPGAVEPRDVGPVDPGVTAADPCLALRTKDEPRHGARLSPPIDPCKPRLVRRTLASGSLPSE